jgi:tripartite-type tricarboxylate transporter receptor subunit TctC
MNSKTVGRALCGAALVAALAVPAAAAADEVADFYKGKTVIAVVGGSVGGGYDLYTRVLIHHMGRHMPGNPAMTMQFMPGAGGTKAANYLYNVAPKDGTYIGLISNAAPMYQALGGSGVKYDAAKFNWIGRAASMQYALMVWADSGVRNINDLKAREVIFGSTGKSQSNYMVPILLKNLLGLKSKVIIGYPGTKEIDLVMQKGEVDGRLGTWASWLIAANGEWVRDKKVIPILQSGLEHMPDLKVPLLRDMAKDDDQRAILELVASDAAVGRAFLLPPAVPTERVEAMRRAFDATMKDPAFVDEAKKLRLIIEPMTGEWVQQVAVKTVSTPPRLIAETKKALEWK